MKSISNQAALQYLRAVRWACPPALRRRLMADLKSGVDEFLVAHPNSTAEDMAARFGDPTQYAAEYIAAIDNKTFTKLLSRRRLAMIWLTVAVVIAVTILLTALYIHAVNSLPPVHVWKTPQTISPPN